MVFEWRNNKIRQGFSKMNLAATERVDWRGEGFLKLLFIAYLFYYYFLLEYSCFTILC